MPRKSKTMKDIVAKVIENKDIEETVEDFENTKLNEMIETEKAVEKTKSKPKRKYTRKKKKEEPKPLPKEPKQEIAMRFILKKDFEERMNYLRKKLVKPTLTQEKRQSYMRYINKLKTKYTVIEV